MTTFETMDLQSADNYLGAKAETISQLARKGELPGVQIGKGWIFLREDVLDFLRRRIASETAARRTAHDSECNNADTDETSDQPVAVLYARTRRRTPPPLPELSTSPITRVERQDRCPANSHAASACEDPDVLLFWR